MDDGAIIEAAVLSMKPLMGALVYLRTVDTMKVVRNIDTPAEYALNNLWVGLFFSER